MMRLINKQAPEGLCAERQRACRLRSVLRLLPICPAILRPGSTREGVADDPMDPCCRCDLEPCVIRPRLWFQRLIVPARVERQPS